MIWGQQEKEESKVRGGMSTDGERGSRVASLPFRGRRWKVRRKRRRAEADFAGRKPPSADRAQHRQDSCDRRAQSWLEGRSGRGVERKRGRESRLTASTPTIGQEEREKEEE